MEINCHPVALRKDESGLYYILLTQVIVFVGHRDPFAYTTFIIYVLERKLLYPLSPEGVFLDRGGRGMLILKTALPPLAIIPTPFFFSPIFWCTVILHCFRSARAP